MSGALVIRGGTVVSSRESLRADVRVEDGRIVAVGEVDPTGAEELDAGGCLVLPGGVDVHTHVFGAIEADTASALAGGTTTVASFLDAEPGETPAAAARRTLAEEVPRSHTDVAFHGVIWEPDAYRPGQIAELAELGVRSLKLWLAYRDLGIMIDDEQAFHVMREAAGEGMLVQAHCENGPLVEALRDVHRASGRTALRHHGEARPAALEGEAVHRFLVIAELAGAVPYVVHVSSRRSLAEIEAARRRGQRVLAEACPHHVAFADDLYARPDVVRFMMTPPLRGEEDRQALLAALADGTIDTFASDHSHLRLDRDKLAVGDDLTRMHYGIPGVGARLAVGYTLGPAAGAMSVERFVELSCEAPARIFGLAPAKGVVTAGADGDLVVWDAERRWTVEPGAFGDGLDYSPYEGMDLCGQARFVVAGGELVAREGRFLGRSRPARYLERGPSELRAAA